MAHGGGAGPADLEALVDNRRAGSRQDQHGTSGHQWRLKRQQTPVSAESFAGSARCSHRLGDQRIGHDSKSTVDLFTRDGKTLGGRKHTAYLGEAYVTAG